MFKITIDGDKTQVSLKTGTKAELCKNVDFNDLMHLLQSHTAHDFGLLPENTRHLSVFGNYFTIVVEVPAGKRSIKVQVGKEIKTVENVHLPGTLFAFNLVFKEGFYRHNTSYIFALDSDRLLQSSDKLYWHPLPNIYPEDQRICWGTGETVLNTPLKSLAGVEGIVRHFYASIANSDLLSTDRTSREFKWNEVPKDRDLKLNVEKYLTMLAQGPFDRKWLKPLKGEFETFKTMVVKVGGRNVK